MLLMDAIPRAFDALTVDAYRDMIAAYFETATHPTLKRRYVACGYQPMVELLRYLEANGFAGVCRPAPAAPACRGEREFDYTAGAEDALERARAQGWTVISVKDDWTTVFAD